jgi:hypothetical protein
MDRALGRRYHTAYLRQRDEEQGVRGAPIGIGVFPVGAGSGLLFARIFGKGTRYPEGCEDDYR